VLCDEYKTKICSELGLKADSSHIAVINNSEEQVEDVCFAKEKIVLFSGRFEQFSKRIDRLMRIWKKASGQIPDWKLILAGDGCDFKMIKDMAAEMELKNIEFLGFQSDMSELYRRSSILCLTSQTEGWGLCLTEAQANGVIPISFACTDAVKYILSPSGVNGFLVDCFDEEQYADVLVSLAKADAQYRLKLQKNVVEKAKMYSPTRIANQWKSVFDSLKYR
jgi:glycosyltransferase involved in cell wall biosynthesis